MIQRTFRGYLTQPRFYFTSDEECLLILLYAKQNDDIIYHPPAKYFISHSSSVSPGEVFFLWLPSKTDWNSMKWIQKRQRKICIMRRIECIELGKNRDKLFQILVFFWIEKNAKWERSEVETCRDSEGDGSQNLFFYQECKFRFSQFPEWNPKKAIIKKRRLDSIFRSLSCESKKNWRLILVFILFLKCDCWFDTMKYLFCVTNTRY